MMITFKVLIPTDAVGAEVDEYYMSKILIKENRIEDQI